MWRRGRRSNRRRWHVETWSTICTIGPIFTNVKGSILTVTIIGYVYPTSTFAEEYLARVHT